MDLNTGRISGPGRGSEANPQSGGETIGTPVSANNADSANGRAGTRRKPASADAGHRGAKGSGDDGRAQKPGSETELHIETPPSLTVEKAKRSRGAKKVKTSDARESATAAIQTVEIFAVARFGAEARFSEEERLLIEPSLAKLIEQYGATIERYGGLLSLIPLLAGVISYASRISTIAVEQDRVRRHTATVPAPSPNGAPPQTAPELKTTPPIGNFDL